MARNFGYDYALRPQGTVDHDVCNARRWATALARSRRVKRLTPVARRARQLTRTNVAPSVAHDVDVPPPTQTQRRVLERVVRSFWGGPPSGPASSEMQAQGHRRQQELTQPLPDPRGPGWGQ